MKQFLSKDAALEHLIVACAPLSSASLDLLERLAHLLSAAPSCMALEAEASIRKLINGQHRSSVDCINELNRIIETLERHSRH